MEHSPERVSEFCNDALGNHDAVGLTELIRGRKVSSQELVEAAVARAERANQRLSAIELKAYVGDQPLLERSNGRGYFAGIPSFIKDNTNIAGWPTRHGSEAVPGYPAKKDGRFAKQFLAQGFVLLGKSRLPEFGFNCSTEFERADPVRNPWNVEHSSGGSSGGAAALVASGVVPLAHANDGGGSTRIPASCCGLVGLKPTRGRLVTHEMAKSLPVKVVCDGVLTRSVRDTAHFMAVAENYWSNRKLPKIGLVEQPSDRRLRIGLMLQSLSGHSPCDQTANTVFEVADELARAGHKISEFQNPCKPNFGEDFATYWGFLAFMAGRFGKHEFGRQFDGSKLDSFTKGLANIFADRWLKMPLGLIRLQRTWKLWVASMRDFDLVLSPVLGHAVPKLGYLKPDVPIDDLLDRLFRYANYTPLNNANGSPAISLPAGFSTEGVPIGVQFSANHGDERTLLEIAFEYERLRPWKLLFNFGNQS
ncbi:MAG: amidase [Pirellulales bacterium]